MSSSQQILLVNALVERELVESIEEAKKLILAGQVKVNNVCADKVGIKIKRSDLIEIISKNPWVSRGAFKLIHALDSFFIDPSDCVCGDAGSCTGGFTEVLIKRGAVKVYAIDSSYGDLAWSLRQNNSVVVMERTNIVEVEALPDKLDLFTLDISLMSLKTVIPAVIKLLKDNGNIIALIKPQYEAPGDLIPRGGVIKNPEDQKAVLRELLNWMNSLKFKPVSLVESPIKGGSGNREFLVLLSKKDDKVFSIENELNNLFSAA